jgi:lipopolysaccharide assembly protein A
MRLVSWIFRIALFLLALGFALTNTTNIDLHFFGVDTPWRAPLVIFLLLFFAAGAVMGLLAVVPTLFRQRRLIGRLKKDLKLGAKPQTGPTAPLADAAPVSSDPPTASRLGF